MRGLLGDATEDMVEKLDDGKDKNINEEEEFKMAAVLNRCEGLDAVMWRLGCVRDFVQGHQLISAALKLLDCCTKLKVGGVNIFIHLLFVYLLLFTGKQAVSLATSTQCSQHFTRSL